MPCSVTPCSVLPCSLLPCSVLPCSTTPCSRTSCSRMPCSRMPCSRMQCALVPLTPNEDHFRLTRGRPGLSGHGIGSVSSSYLAPATSPVRADGSSTCKVLGRTPCRIASTILMTPTDARRRLGVPDVGFQRPQPQRPICIPVLPVSGQQCLRLDRIAQASSWYRALSTRQRHGRSRPAVARAWRITRCCDGLLRRRQPLFEAPSWFTALEPAAPPAPHGPRRRASIRQPLQQQQPRHPRTTRCHQRRRRTTCTAHRMPGRPGP